MQILNLGWHDYLVLISFAACIAGLFLLPDDSQTQGNEMEETERSLLSMSFAYWMVYCVAVGIGKICSPESEIVLLSLRLTAAFSYFLTFACVLSLPLSRIAVRHVEE
jgi:hypothetical protein